jgi:hypothetical protein
MTFSAFMRFGMVDSLLCHGSGGAVALAVSGLLACGPKTGDGSSDTGASSPTAGETSGESATSDTTDGLDCSASDLPPPFCHRRVPVAAIEPGELPSSSPVLIVPTPAPMWRPLVGLVYPTELRVADPETSALVATASLGPYDLSGLIGPATYFADVDGDGVPEIAIGTSRDVMPFFRLPTLEAVAELPEPVPDPESGIGSARLQYGPLDVDHDGSDEIFVTPGSWRGSGVPAYEIWAHANGELVLLDDDDEWEGCRPWGMKTADIDGDGFAELLFAEGVQCYHKQQSGYDPEWDRVVVLSGSPGATRPAAARFPMGYISEQIFVGDFDGDGRDDVLVRRFSDARDIAVLFADGEGGLEEPVIMDFSEYEGSLDSPAGLITRDRKGAIGDFDRSGRHKVLAELKNQSTGESGPVLVGFSRDGIELLWIGDSLGTKVELVGDINHDGVTDIIGEDGIYISITP